MTHVENWLHHKDILALVIGLMVVVAPGGWLISLFAPVAGHQQRARARTTVVACGGGQTTQTFGNVVLASLAGGPGSGPFAVAGVLRKPGDDEDGRIAARVG